MAKKTLFKKKHEAFTNMTFFNNFNESFMVTFRDLVICCCFNLAGSGKVPEVERYRKWRILKDLSQSIRPL